MSAQTDLRRRPRRFYPQSGSFPGIRASSPVRQTHSSLHPFNQAFPRHPQIAQGKQRDQLRGVLGQATVAHLDEAELTFDHPERMLNLGPDAGFDLLELFDQLMTAPA